MINPFLTAEWKNLIMFNYATDPSVLLPYLPAHTIPDTYKDVHYVSLVGFMFQHTKVLGVKIPFHINFEEVNLRFYVKRKVNGEWRRGVVFVREIVPKHAIAFVANNLYSEHYSVMPMRHEVKNGTTLSVRYGWKHKGAWNEMGISTAKMPVAMQAGSSEEFITEHYWGYNRVSASRTTEYKVEHPKWNYFPVDEYSVDCRFSELYGNDFAFLHNAKPLSVFMADGSAISVGKGTRI